MVFSRNIVIVLFLFLIPICFLVSQSPLTIDPSGQILVEVNGESVSLVEFLVPVGTVESYLGDTAPDGWLICNGSEISRSNYSRLFLLLGTKYGSGDGTTTFNLPDLRGMFLRGTDSSAGRDPDSTERTDQSGTTVIGDVVGSVQADAFQGHTHAYSAPSGNNHMPTLPNRTYAAHSNRATYNTTSIGALGSYGTPRYSSETRPMNMSVNFIIKY